MVETTLQLFIVLLEHYRTQSDGHKLKMEPSYGNTYRMACASQGQRLCTASIFNASKWSLPRAVELYKSCQPTELIKRLKLYSTEAQFCSCVLTPLLCRICFVTPPIYEQLKLCLMPFTSDQICSPIGNFISQAYIMPVWKNSYERHGFIIYINVTTKIIL